MAEREESWRGICEFCPQRGNGDVKSLTIDEATLDFPSRRKSRASRNSERERERDYTARAIFETRLGLITNQLTRNFPPFDDSRIRNRSSSWRKTGSIGSRERGWERCKAFFLAPVFPTIFKTVLLNFWFRL